MSLINIDNTIIQTYQQGIDDLINQLGKNCRLVFPPRIIPCPNCILDPNTKMSTGYYKAGGPYFFDDGTICPMCNGGGQQSIESTKTIKMLVEWNPKNVLSKLKDYNIQITSPHSIALTKTFLIYVPDILQCQYAILDTGVEAMLSLKCYKISEPVLSGLQVSRYATIIWERR